MTADAKTYVAFIQLTNPTYWTEIVISEVEANSLRRMDFTGDFRVTGVDGGFVYVVRDNLHHVIVRPSNDPAVG